MLWACIVGLLYYNSYLIHLELCGNNNGVTPDYCYTFPEIGLQVLSYLVFLGLLVYIVCLIAFRHRMQTALQLVQLTAEPILKIKSLFLVPVLQIILGLLVVGACFALVLWTLSIGRVLTLTNNDVPGGSVNSLTFESQDKVVLGFVLLLCFWWLSFLIAFGEFIMGGLIGCWFFTKEKSALFDPVSRSSSNCFRFHLGSVVRGALYNLLFSMPNSLLSGLCAFFKSHKQSSCAVCLAYLCCPLASCYQSFTKYNTRISYIYLSIFALPYSLSSQQCYYLVQRNYDRIHTPLQAVGYEIGQVKLSICLLGFVVTYAALTASPVTLLGFSTGNLSSTLAPCIFTLVACAYLAEATGGCMQACINSMGICGVVDEEMFTAEQRFMNTEMQGVLDKAAVETRVVESKVIEVQKPGRSNRVAMNVVEVDKEFSVRVTPRTQRNGGSGMSEVSVFNFDN